MVWNTICLHHEQIMLKICMLELLILLDYKIILFFPPPLHLFDLIWFDLFAFHWSIQDYKIHKDIEIVNCDQYKIKYIY